MIITGSRISTSSGAAAVGSHVLSGPANERIGVLQGCQADLDDMVRDAEVHGAKYALRHWKVSPKEGMSTDDARVIASDLAKEFGADPERLVIVEHQKPRAGGAGYDRHWHVIAPEVDPIEGRVLDSSWMRLRHEKLARIAEERLGHAMVPGRWNAAVARAIKDDRPELSERVAAVAQQTRPESGYTATQHQVAARHGHAMPHDRLAVALAWKASDGPQAFAAALAHQGISIRSGDKPGTYIAERDGQLIGAIHRLIGEKKGEVAQRFEGVDFQASIIPEQAVIDAEIPVSIDMASPEKLALLVSDAAPKETPVAVPTEEEAAASTATHETKSTVSRPMGGGTGASSGASESGSTGASLQDVGDGPGPPPGPGASPDERAKWLAKLADYDDRKAAAWARWVASHKKPEQTSQINKGQAGENNVDIRKQTEAESETIRNALGNFAQAYRRANTKTETAGTRNATDQGDNRATSISNPAHDGHDNADARPGRAGSGLVARTDDTQGNGRSESDRRTASNNAGGSRPSTWWNLGVGLGWPLITRPRWKSGV